MIDRLKNAVKCILGIPISVRPPKEIEKIAIEHVLDPSQSMKGRVALITGGSGGIGKSIAKLFVESGCRVIITGTNVQKLNTITQEIGENCASIVLDYQNPETFEAKLEEAGKIWGQIDTLVNSVGIHTPNVDFWKLTQADWDNVMSVNLKGTFFFCRCFADYMIKNQTAGNILLISSSRGSEPAFSPYGASKWALNGLTRGLSKILFPYGITVNAIAPGTAATEMVGINPEGSISSKESVLGRLIMPQEIAHLARLLVSRTGNAIVGQTIMFSAARGVWDIR